MLNLVKKRVGIKKGWKIWILDEYRRALHCFREIIPVPGLDEVESNLQMFDSLIF